MLLGTPSVNVLLLLIITYYSVVSLCFVGHKYLVKTFSILVYHLPQFNGLVLLKGWLFLVQKQMKKMITIDFQNPISSHIINLHLPF